MRMLDPVASRIPWMTAAGNHEIEDGTTVGGPFCAYEHRFDMPAIGPAVRSLDCGQGGGVYGDGTGCGQQEGPVLDLLDAAEAPDEGLFGEGVASAARRVRGAQGPGGVPVGSGRLTPDSSEEGGVEYEVTAAGCTPSEWSGTYDYGNRCADRWPASCAVASPGSVSCAGGMRVVRSPVERDVVGRARLRPCG